MAQAAPSSSLDNEVRQFEHMLSHVKMGRLNSQNGRPGTNKESSGANGGAPPPYKDKLLGLINQDMIPLKELNQKISNSSQGGPSHPGASLPDGGSQSAVDFIQKPFQ